MVKTRPTRSGSKVRLVMQRVHNRFGRTLTHRLVAETTNAEQQTTSISTTDTQFTGDLQSGAEIDLKLLEHGFVQAGDAVLYVAATQSEAANIVPRQSIIIEGTVAGTHTAWNVTDVLNKEWVKTDIVAYVFKLTRRTDEVIS